MKKFQKRLMCILLSVILLVSVLPMTVYADSATVINVSTAEELTNACSTINAGSGAYVINLTDDISGGSIDISNGSAVVTVIGNGHTITQPATAVHVSGGATVNLGDGSSALTFSSGTYGSDPGIVYVQENSTCNMYTGVTLKDRKNDNYFGGGVTVDGGTFHMYGGTIQNCGIDGGSVCYGGGVAVYNSGAFIMDDGVITECYAYSDYISDYDPTRCYTAMGGGVFVTAGSTFTMNGGTISNCEATNMGGGVAMAISDSMSTQDELELFGMGNPKSKVTINNGTICGNKAQLGAGVFASGYFYAYSSAFQMNSPGTGLPEDPGLYINGAEISSNEADELGGGVLVAMIRPAAKIRIHNAEITENTAYSGAGIESYGYWTQMDIDGCTITDNAAESNGGGVMVDTNTSGGYTSIKDTTITGNTSGGRGAGVYYNDKSEIRIAGADVIQDNLYNGKQNNLNILSLENPVKVVGDLTGSQIGLSDPTLWDDGKEDTAVDAVSTLRLTDGFKTNNDSLIPADAFTSDHESWIVDYGEIKYKEVASDEDYYTYEGTKYAAVSRTDTGESCSGELYSVKAKTFTDGVAENPTVFKNEVLSNFSDTSKYQPEYSDDNWNEYTKLDTGDYVAVYFRNQYNAYIYLNPNSNYSNPRLITSTGHQTQYAQSGEFVYQYYTADYETIEYSNTGESIEVHDTELLSEDEIIYDYDEFGYIISKTVVNKTPVKTPHQVETVLDYDYTGEVRLVRAPINYHINNDVIDDKYDNNDIFTAYVEEVTGEITVGETIEEFYLIPEVTATADNSCPYIFKGWYYDQDNDNDTRPVVFDTDVYSKDIYAHWITVEDVEKDEEDTNDLPPGETKYGGFDLAGVQIRKEMMDYNFDEIKPGGMRFITSLNMDVVKEINKIKANNIEYGYVAATDEGWINYHKGYEKLQYVSTNTNGINTSDGDNENYFGFAHNVNCTSRVAKGSSNVVPLDHQNYSGYLIYSLVITYEGDDANGKDTNVLARPYIKYTDANGLDRVVYSEYRGESNTLGGCYTNYNANVH